MKEISDVKEKQEIPKDRQTDIKIKSLIDEPLQFADKVFDKLSDNMDKPTNELKDKKFFEVPDKRQDAAEQTDKTDDASLKKADSIFSAFEKSLDDQEKDNKRIDIDTPVTIENSRRDLTKEEKDVYRKEGFSYKFLENCTVDTVGSEKVFHYKTKCSDLDGKTYKNGVPFRSRIIEINGRKVEGVFPEFKSAFDTYLTKENFTKKTYAKECNAHLKESIAKDPKLRSKFTKEQLKEIKEGKAPSGYVWHHNEEPGKMQLVKEEDHNIAVGGAPHTGGSSLWGYNSVDNGKKGESF